MAMLVTGGAGFLGSAFVRLQRRRHPGRALIVLDKLSYAGSRDRLAGVAGVDLVEGDIADTGLVLALLRERGVDCIVNFAAESHVDRSIIGPAPFIHSNLVGSFSLLEAARIAWQGLAHRFHQVSTDEVFGALGPDDAPFRADSPYRPSSPYAASKAGADHLVRAWARSYGLNVTISMGANGYGPWQHVEKLVPHTIAHALSGRPIALYGDGRQRREWLHADDQAAAISAMVEQGAAGETVLLAGQERENRWIVETLCAAVDRLLARRADLRERFPEAPAARGNPSASLVRHVADRPGHDWRYASERAAAAPAPRPLDAGLAETVLWYARHPRWWRPQLD